MCRESKKNEITQDNILFEPYYCLESKTSIHFKFTIISRHTKMEATPYSTHIVKIQFFPLNPEESMWLLQLEENLMADNQLIKPKKHREI